MNLITIDFETYYDPEFSLTKISTEEYIRADNFQVIGFAYKINDGPTKWVTGSDDFMALVLRNLPWETSFVLAHNTMFDGAILSWRYDVTPKGWLDTLSMGRALHGVEAGGSLKAMAERYGVGEKGAEVSKFVGYRRNNFSEDQLAAYGQYCANDVELTHLIFHKMMRQDFPLSELKLIDLTLRMFTHPVLELDGRALKKHLEDVVASKQAHLVGALQAIGHKDLAVKQIIGDEKMKAEVRSVLMSNPKFASMIKTLGVEPPKKISMATGKETFAFAKSDEAFKKLLEHEDLRVQALASARIGTKSTLEETRTQRFIALSERGKFPVPLKYYAAHTGRWGGTDSVNLQNLPSRGANAGKLKKAILAPEGYVFIDADSSQIEARTLAWEAGQDDLVQAFAKGEDVYKIMASSIYHKTTEGVTTPERFVGKTTILGCFGADTQVLTNTGWKRIIEVQSTDTLWDGQEWVTHRGVIAKGLKETIQAWGLCATPEHEILTEHGWRAWREVTTNPSLSQSAFAKARSLSWVGSRIANPTADLRGGTRECSVLAAGWGRLIAITSKLAAQLGVTLAARSRPTQNGIGLTNLYYQMRRIGRDFLTAFHHVSHVAITPVQRFTPTMVEGGSMCIPHGVPTEYRSSSICLPFLGGMTPNETLTGLITTRGMSPVTYGLQRAGRMLGTSEQSKSCRQKLQTYDIAYAGPRNRFTIATNVGPLIVHNCGYGMGGPKFKAQLKTFGTDVTEEEAKRIITTYRAAYPKIPHLWQMSHEALRCMVRGQTMKLANNLLEVDANGIKLPNGLHIHYKGLREMADEQGKRQFVYDTRQGQTKIYGGKVVENFTQAVARCIIGEQMLKIAKRYRVVLTVHDAIGIIAREAEAEEARAYVESCMRWVPSWAEGLPVNCESGMGKSYGDC